MLKFYYSKGSSAVAAHILLEEVGATYEAIEISIQAGHHRKPSFLMGNPKGRIPVLETPDGILSENPAILEYIAATHRAAGMIPDTPFKQAQARSLAAYLCATVHVAFAHHKRAERWADLPATQQDLQKTAARNIKDCIQLLEHSLPLGPWAMGQTYGFCDPYLFLLGQWAAAVGETLQAAPKLRAHHDAMRRRPATQKIWALHQVP